uniref:Major facilitator superfamily (MFS) profile domain-containing protein n=1 Tax=Plectus sambesii TaxID=2011161 RepID=A0A914WCM7_9BILA
MSLEKGSSVSYKLVIGALLHALLGFSASHYTTAFNPIESLVKDFANQSISRHYNVTLDAGGMSWIWACLAGANALGAFVGAFLLPYPADKFGSRDTVMVFENIIELLAGVIQFVAVTWLNSVELLFVGRIFSGIALSFAMYVPVFLSECAPISQRGLFATISFLGIPFWNTIGATVGLPQLLGTADLWKWILVLPLIPAIIHLSLTPLFPKSPKFLYISKGSVEESIEAIIFYHGRTVDRNTVLAALDREAQLGRSSCNKQYATLREILKTRHLRMALFICVVANCAAELGGSDIATQYSTGFMTQLGVSSETSAWLTVLLLRAPACIAVLAGTILVDRCGRRPLMLCGLGMGVFATGTMFVSGLVSVSPTSSIIGVVGLFCSLIGYYSGPSFVAKMLPGELCPQASRSLTSAICFGGSWVPAIVEIFGFPPLQQSIGTFSFLPLFALGIISFVTLFIYLPETKGRDVDDIIGQWVSKDFDQEQTHLLKPSDKLHDVSSGYGTLTTRKSF